MKSRIILYSVLIIIILSFVFFVGTLTIFSSTKTIEYPGEGVYEGELKGKLFHGQGTWKSDLGVIYEGSFDNGKFHGTGTLIFADGSTYTGGFKNGLMYGQGMMTFPDGHTHKGYWNYDKLLGDHEDCDHDH